MYNKARIFLSDDGDLEEDIYMIQAGAEAIKSRFDAWPSAQSGNWLQQTLPTFELPSSYPDLRLCSQPWTSYFDCTYSDSYGHCCLLVLRSRAYRSITQRRLTNNGAVYIAAVWNTYRKAHIMALDIIARCKRRLQSTDICTEIQEEAELHVLAQDIMASMPYHLNPNSSASDSCNESINNIGPNHASTELQQPSVAAGLLLIHPLWVVATSESTYESTRTMAREMLSWIGTHLGIGQATLLADVRSSLVKRRFRLTYG